MLRWDEISTTLWGREGSSSGVGSYRSRASSWAVAPGACGSSLAAIRERRSLSQLKSRIAKERQILLDTALVSGDHQSESWGLTFHIACIPEIVAVVHLVEGFRSSTGPHDPTTSVPVVVRIPIRPH